jgi:hypothetical protein
MTPEQISQISALGYFVVNHGQHVEDINKNIVVSKDADGNYVTDIPEIQEILGEVKKVRARNKKGQLMADDPSTPDVNEAWTTKIIKKVTRKKKKE